MTRRCPHALLRLCCLLLLAGAPALADDGDGGSGGGGGGGGGGSADGGGGGGGGETHLPRRGFDLGPNPGTNPLQDARRLIGSLFGASAPPPPAAPASPAPVAPPPAPGIELVARRLPPAALAAARAEGFIVLAQRQGAGGLLLVRLRAAPGLTANAAIARLRALAPAADIDRNHLYRQVAEPGGPAPSPVVAAEPDHGAGAAPAAISAAGLAPAPAPSALGPVPAPLAGPRCQARGIIAIVDSGADARHPALAGVALTQESWRGPGRRAARNQHGTAVAVLLAQALPGASLLVLDAFHRGPDGEAADSFDLAAALDRAAAVRAAVVNLSFAGPNNQVLDAAGRDAAAAGVLLVAAAGNEGPRAPPRFPAAFPWAVAVTAVDAELRAWARAAAGPHIAFAARGVDVTVPGVGTQPARRWSGTSFAAPLVSASLGGAPAGRPPDAVLAGLAAAARDLGAPGRDPVFGWGMPPPPGC